MRLLLSTLLLLLATTASALPPRTMGYQGVLTDDLGNVVPDGTYSMTFRIYLVPSGAAAQWTETHSVEVTNGNFDVILGSTTPLSQLTFNDPYWLGLQVGSDPEMTPRTELTGAAYSQMARTVEPSSITASRIANNTVVRSLNGIDDAVSLVGGANVTVTPVGNSLEISAEGTGEAPGVASAKGITSGGLSSSLSDVVSRSINCPSDGYVLAMGSADVYLNHTAGNPTYVQIGLSDESTSLPFNQDRVAQIPFSAPTGLYTIPLSTNAIFPVTAGSHTFYMLGRLGSLSGSASVTNRQISLLYVEMAYGTVSQQILGDPSESHEATSAGR